MIFPGTTASTVCLLTRALCFCPHPALKTNNLLSLLTPWHLQFISTFPVRKKKPRITVFSASPLVTSPLFLIKCTQPGLCFDYFAAFILSTCFIQIRTLKREWQSRWATAGDVWVDVGCIMSRFCLKRLRLSEFSAISAIVCALECGHDWQRKCSIWRDLCTWPTVWECTNALCTSDSACHFLIMVCFPASFS